MGYNPFNKQLMDSDFHLSYFAAIFPNNFNFTKVSVHALF